MFNNSGCGYRCATLLTVLMACCRCAIFNAMLSLSLVCRRCVFVFNTDVMLVFNAVLSLSFNALSSDASMLLML
jgi:hypothetical protein